MRKKYLSALLFGALLFASAGTFTSCKDYDDDINNLQDQITANADAIKALQDIVNAGKYVSGVAMEGQTITFTFSDGSTQDVVIPEGEKGQTVVVKDGELYIDDEPTGIKVPETAEVQTGLVKAENGTWWVLNENGEYTNTNIPVSGVTVSGSEKDGYTFTIYNEKGEAQVVKLPTAASSITSMSLGESTHNPTAYELIFGKNAFVLTTETFVLNGPSTDKGNVTLNSASEWKGNKKLPANESVIYASPTTIDLRVNPVNVAAENLNFYLTNTKNQDLSPVVLTASAEDGDTPLSNTNGRAANVGNGLYTLSMENVVVSKDESAVMYQALIEAQNGQYVHAVNAEHSFRTEYKINVGAASPEQLSTITLQQGTTSYTIAKNASNGDTKDNKYKVGTPVKVKATEASALYDMYLDADQSDRDVYQLSFDQDNHTFTIGKNPDVSTVDASFNLIVYTVANNGSVNKATIKVVIDTEISASTEYGLHEHSVNKEEDVNYFGIDLATMKTALGDNLNQWLQNVDLKNVTYEWSEKENGEFVDMPKAIEPWVVEKTGKKSEIKGATTDRNKANYIQVNVNNDYAKGLGLKLDKTYYIKATFKTSDGSVLNSIVVPVEFHAPALADLFTVKDGYVVDNVINAYFYKIANVDGEKTTTTAVDLVKYFSESVKDATVAYQTGNVDDTNKKASELFTTFATGATFGNSTVDLKDKFNTSNNTVPAGYGKAVIINVTKDNYANWLYTTEGDDTYSFKIRLMSPIYEGSVVPAEGNTISINGNDLVKGALITSEDIIGKDYNNNTYNVVPDLYVDGEVSDWANPQIEKVTPNKDTDEYIKGVELVPATEDKDGKTVAGAFKLTGESISNTVTVQMPVDVQDAWGYVKKENVSVTIVKQ